MNDKITQRIANMKTQTIGVEIEMADITRSKAINILAEHFGHRNVYVHVGGSYDAYTTVDPKGRTWTISRDSSIIARNQFEKAELATPILHYEDIDDLQQIVRELRKSGAVSDPRHGCGVHIHIGADGHTAASLRNLANIMAAHETILTDALSIAYQRRHTFCQPVDPDFLRAVNARKPETMSALADIWYTSQHANRDRSAHYNPSRYHMLNLHATFTKGTVEFRLFQFDNLTRDENGKKHGGMHAGAIKAYIQLCLMLSQAAKDAKSASPKEPQVENPKYAMRTWLLRLGFIGDEFKTARDILTRRLAGDAAFRHGRAA